MLAVTDTGHGMDTETLTHVFEPFFTTKPPGEGTGLGLSTVYGIVKQSGGYISVYSEPEHGSSFKVYLPQANGSNESNPPGGCWRPTRGHETILVVEDEPAVRALISRILTRKGYALIEARDGIEAQQLLRNSETPIDLLLSDVMLPGGVQGHLLASSFRRIIPSSRCSSCPATRRMPLCMMAGWTGESTSSRNRSPPRFWSPRCVRSLTQSKVDCRLESQQHNHRMVLAHETRYLVSGGAGRLLDWGTRWSKSRRWLTCM